MLEKKSKNISALCIIVLSVILIGTAIYFHLNEIESVSKSTRLLITHVGFTITSLILVFIVLFFFKNKQLQTLAEVITKQVDESIYIVNAKLKITYVNEIFCTQSGHKEDQLIGQHISISKSSIYDHDFYALLQNELRQKGSWQGEITELNKDGSTFLTYTRIHALNKTRTRFIILQKNINYVKNLMEENQHIKYFSESTKLPNEKLFEKDFEYIKEQNAPKMLYYCKILNQVHIESKVGKTGFTQSILILKEILNTEFDVCKIYKLDYNSLGFLLDGVEIETEKIDAVLKSTTSLEILGQAIKLNIKFGIAKYPDDGDEVDEIVSSAQMALHHIIDKNNVFYHTIPYYSKQQIIYQAELEMELPKAIERNELMMYYQPQISVQTGEVVGVEALARWHHNKHGFVSPELFIGIAQKNGYMATLDDFIFNQVLEDFREIKKYKQLRMSINLSAQQFVSKDFISKFEKLLKKYETDPKDIILEMTENDAVEDLRELSYYAHKIKEIGCKLSIDDFGTGYNAIAMLFNIPFDEIKLDRSYLKPIMRDRDIAIIKSIITLSELIHVNNVIEGVESHAQKEILTQLNCKNMQGYLFSKPVPLESFIQYIK